MVNLGSIMGNPSLSSYYGKFFGRREIAIEWTKRGEGMPGMWYKTLRDERERTR